MCRCWGSPGGGDHRRNGVPEEGHPFSRGGATVQRDGGTGGELPSEGLPALRGGIGVHAAGRGTSRRDGPTSRPGCSALAWCRTRPLPPSRNWPNGCWPGSWAIRFTTTRVSCGPGWRIRIRPTFWRCRRIESVFELAKQEMGLDKYEVRNARGWDRHMRPYGRWPSLEQL